MKIEVFESVQSCSGRLEDWNAFAGECGDDVSLTYEWHRALEVSQEAQGPVRTLWLSRDGQLKAILPTRVERTRLRGIPLRQLSPLGSSYCAHDCLLVCPTSLEALEEALRISKDALASWDVFRFSASENSRVYLDLDAARPASHSRVEWTDGRRSPYLALPGTFDDFQRGLSTKRRTAIRSRVKKLKERGEPRLRVITQPGDVGEAMDIVRGIELASWKQPAGTSITANPYQAVFYDALARGLAEQGWLRLYVLYLGDQPIAHDIGYQYRGRFVSGKTSFVEELRHLQPGFVLRWLILGDLYQHGVREHDFIGDPDPYKLHWTDVMRRHRNIRLFRAGVRTGLARILRTWRAKPRDEAAGSSPSVD